MAFLAPAITPLINMGIGAVAGKVAGKLSGPSPQQTAASNQLNLLTNETLTRARGMDALADSSRKEGMSFLSRFSNQLSQPTNYFQQILSGNPNSTLTSVLPALRQLQGNQSTALRTAQSLTPRGGARSSMIFDLPLSGASQTSSLFAGGQQTAANTLPQIAGMQGDVGTNFLRLAESQSGQSNGLFDSALRSTGAQLDQANKLNQQEYQKGQAFAQMFAPVLEKLDWQKFFTRTPRPQINLPAQGPLSGYGIGGMTLPGYR